MHHHSDNSNSGEQKVVGKQEQEQVQERDEEDELAKLGENPSGNPSRNSSGDPLGVIDSGTRTNRAEQFLLLSSSSRKRRKGVKGNGYVQVQGISEELKARLARDDKYVILPSNSYIVLFDMVVLLLIMVQVFLVPFSIGLSGTTLLIGPHSLAWELVFPNIINFIFLIDTAFYFLRATYDHHGRLIQNLDVIAWRYFQGWFIIDLLACTPTNLIQWAALEYSRNGSEDSSDGSDVAASFVRLLNLLVLFRIPRIRRTLRRSPMLSRLQLKAPYLLREGTVLIFQIILVLHYMACMWGLLYLVERGSERNWVFKYMQSDPPPLIDPEGSSRVSIMDRYVLAMYWSVTIIVGIGYGDITPYSRGEFWLATLTILVSALMWAFLVATAVNIVASSRLQKNMFHNRLHRMNTIVLRAQQSQINLLNNSDFIRKHKWNNSSQSKHSLKGTNTSVWQTGPGEYQGTTSQVHKGETFEPDPTLPDDLNMFLLTQYKSGASKFSTLDEGDELLNYLSPGLRSRLLFEQSRPFLLAVPLFFNADARTAEYLASKMGTESFAAGEKYSEDFPHNGQQRIFIITSGSCMACYQNYRKLANVILEPASPDTLVDETEVKRMEPALLDRASRTNRLSVKTAGDHFGLSAVLAPEQCSRRSTNVRVLSFMDTTCISANEIHAAANMDTNFYRWIKSIQARILLKWWAVSVLSRLKGSSIGSN